MFALPSIDTGQFKRITIVMLLAAAWGTFYGDAAAQETVSKGVVTISFRPDGLSGVVTIDLPKEGVTDGRPEWIFFLQGGPTEFVRVTGPGTVELVQQGVLHVRIEKNEELLFVKKDVADTDASLRPGVRTIRVSEMIRGFAVPPDAQTPRGTPGTGRVTQERIEEPLAPRKK